jgi:dsRNA-specific ribonuclease
MTTELTYNKRRLVGGICITTRSITPIEDLTFKPRKKTTPSTITQSAQYCRANFRGALQEHFKKYRPNFKLCFETAKEEKDNIFVSTCKVDEAIGVGRARAKKKATQLAALDVLVKMGLVSDGESGGLHGQSDSEVLELGTKDVAPIFENEQYKRDNFRGALQEYIQKLGREVNILFETTQPLPKKFVSKCSFSGILGSGEAGNKKKAIQLAAFDLICKLGLLSEEEIERQSERMKKPKEIRSFSIEIPMNIIASKAIPPIIQSEQYRKNNFRGVLQEYCQKLGGADVILNFATISKTQKSFTSMCVINGIKGVGKASNKKDAIQLAALDLIVKLGLLSHEEVEKQQV